MQYFKGDDTELKMIESGKSPIDQISIQLDAFWEGAYEAGPLGDVIFEDERSPLANAIDQDVFRASFPDIFDAFVAGGTFESYITVFKKIFGDDVEIEFTVPGPGKLNIDITASGVEESFFVTRYIVDNEYVFDEIIDDEEDNIVFQTVKGFQSQYELEQMLFEMVPAGIYTEITLDLA